ncbi:unnamed protein product [Phytophthora lilii]|uniref:Unnamed protein product n=1 Tax=Phytophthora lilii TaxID=2077276 RepID=A0A9W6TU50_9STRA|nr:unnamed protein product [Phytophthora lilii]
MESREKRMALGSLLLDWGVNKDTVVEICYLESPNETVHTNGTHISSLASKKVALVSPRRQSGLIHSRLRSNTNQESHENSNNNDEDEKEDAASDEDEIVDSMTDSHVKTVRPSVFNVCLRMRSDNGIVYQIEYLIERLSALEADKRKTEAYVSKLETENRELRKELESQAKEPPTLGISSIEAQIIAQLETSITSLAEQVEHMEHEKQHQPFTSASSTSLSS